MRLKEALALIILSVLFMPICWAISSVQHSVSGNTVTLTYDGTPPFNIDIRGSTDFSKEGSSYARAKVFSNSYSNDMSFAYNPSGVFYYRVKDAAGWSDTGSFSLGAELEAGACQDPLDTSQSFSHGVIGLSNGDQRFLCYDGNWYSCSWAEQTEWEEYEDLLYTLVNNIAIYKQVDGGYVEEFLCDEDAYPSWTKGVEEAEAEEGRYTEYWDSDEADGCTEAGLEKGYTGQSF